MAWVEKDHNDLLVSAPLLCAGSPTTRPGCPEPSVHQLQNNSSVGIHRGAQLGIFSLTDCTFCLGSAVLDSHVAGVTNPAIFWLLVAGMAVSIPIRNEGELAFPGGLCSAQQQDSFPSVSALELWGR